MEFPVVSGFTICDELGTASIAFFYNLALLSIYSNDGTAISTWGVIIIIYYNIIFGKLYISNEEDFCHQLYFSLPLIEPKQRALSLF